MKPVSKWRMSKRYWPALIFLFVVACSGDQSNEPMANDLLPPEKWTWVSGPEGSMVHKQFDPYTQAVTRCWPDGNKQLCLWVSGMPTEFGDVQFFSGIAYTRTNLPENLSDLLNPESRGYSCQIFGDKDFVNEQISGEHSHVKEQLSGQGAGTPPWEKGEVDKFAKDNGLRMDNRHFNCAHLLDVIRSGSVESIATTQVTREALFD